ncbi:MAG: TrkH family potassium uptake protein [Firmicutes bacterium]|nr:TrkH family potassium uptake protein [Bacillota bacterium]
MSFGLVSRVLGNLLLIEATVLSIPLAVSLHYREQQSMMAFLLSMGIAGLFGLFLSNIQVKSSRLRVREALLIVTLGWVVASIFGSLPFVLSGSVASFVDGFFETVSGLTTTGFTIVNHVESLSKGIMLWRSLLHWLGGMGILVLSLAILPTLGVAGFQVFRAESPGPAPEKFTPRVAATSKILYTIYVTFTIVQILVMHVAGLSWFDSFLLSFSTVGTGGFAPYNDSLARYSSNNLLFYSIAVGMILSGVNFSLYYDLGKRRWKQVINNAELRLYLAILAVSVLAIALNLYRTVYTSGAETLKQALFHVSSVMTTTGFSATDFDLWPSFSKGILFALMFVGGSAGSTSGSVKVIRLLVASKVVKREIAKTLHPQVATPIVINGRVVKSEVVQGVVSFYLLYFAVFIVGSLLISLEGLDLFSSMGAVAASLGNIGLGFGQVGPTGSFALFSPVGKLFLSFLMLLGRLELFTLLAVLNPRFWREY